MSDKPDARSRPDLGRRILITVPIAIAVLIAVACFYFGVQGAVQGIGDLETDR